jgi:PAS domain S-box-containing protein
MTKPLRILILEDQPADAELVSRELRDAGFDFVAKRVATENEFLAELWNHAPQLILADYSLPAYDGLSALAAAQKQCPQTPFIFVSGSLGEERAIETLQRGATDYVLKERLARLGPAVRRALRERDEMRKREQAQKERQESEEQFRAMFEVASIGMAQSDPRTGQWLRVNQKMCAITGYSAAEMLRMRVSELTHPDDRQKDWEEFCRVVRGEASDYHLEKRYVRKGGAVVWVNVNMTVIRDAAGQPMRTMATIEDITERKQVEQRVRELNMVLRASGAINALMVRERDPRRLLAEASKILVETRGYQLAWIGLVKPNSKQVVPEASAGKDAGYLDAVSITWDETPTGQRPIGAAIRTRQPVACQDTATDPRFAPWREAAMAHGFASVAAMPMIHGSRVLGAVAVYSERTGAFDAEELALLKELASDLAFALQSIEHEQERIRAEESLRENGQRYRLLFNSGYDAVFVHQGGSAGGASGKFIEVNDIACQRLGYTRQELLQMSARDINAPETLPDIPRIRAKLAVNKSTISEGVHLTKGGRRIPVEISTYVFELNGKPTRLSTVRDITERKGAEARLHLLSKALESAANAIVITDRGGTITWANPAFSKLSGYRLEEALGRKPSLVKSGEHDQAFYQTLWETVLAGRVWSAEMINRRKDGSLYTEENTITPVSNEQGEVTHFIAVKQDITERKRAEATLRQKEEYFRALTEQATDVTTLLNADGTIRYDSPSVERVLGYKPDELIGRSVFDLIHPEDLARAQQALAESVLTPGSTTRIETRLRHKDGSWRVVEASTRNLLDDPSVRGIIINSRDVTERRRLEEDLRESSQFNQQIVASAQEGIIVYGRDLKYQVWNTFMEQLTGITASKVLGKHPEEVFPFLRDTGVLASLKRALDGESTPALDVPFEGLPSGKSGWTSDTNGPLRNAAGEIIGVIGIVRDITERKQAELRIAAFASLGPRLNAAKTAREAGKIIVGMADELLGWDACLFHLYSVPKNRLSALVCMDLINGRRTECKPPGFPRSPTDYAKRAIEQGGQLIFRDHPQAMQPEGLPFGVTSRLSASIIWVPVRHGTEIVGVLSIQSYTPRAYDASSLETLQALADHGGGALERLRTQEALGESEANFRSVWERSADGMRLTDKEGRITAVNEAFCRLVQLPREKLEGQIFSVAYKGHGPTDGIELYQKRFATEAIIPRLTTRTQLWNGAEVDLEISNSFIELGQRGKMLLGIFRDVSERKHAELRIEAFSKLGQRLSAAKTAREAAGIISEVAGDLLGWDACSFSLCLPSRDLLNHVLQLDTIEGRRVEFSPGLEPLSVTARRAVETGGQLILKDKPDQMLPGGQPFGDSTRPSASIMYVPIRKGAEAVGVMSIQSYTPRAYDAKSLETLQALADHCGGALDRLRMEDAWQTTQHRLGHLLTQSPAVIYSLKTDGKTTEPAWVSDNVERLLGYTVDECYGPDGLFNQFHPQDRQAVIDGLVQLLAKGQIARDYRVRHKNGEYRWVRDEQRLICDAAGAPVEIVGSWVDITERKVLEEQLRQAQKMEAVGQLAGGVAHDFNNMLAVIRGNAELLLMDEDQYTTEAKEGLKHMVEASERAATLTRQLLAFSRKQILQPQPLVLNEVIANLTKMLKRVMGENIDMKCDFAAPLPYVQADPGMMEQVILNFVVNARDAMPGGGKLRVATEHVQLDEAQARVTPEARAGEFVCLLVSDTGTGIAPEVLPRIFEPFFTTKAIGKGTGLGLATVYGIVQQHQGWIEVSSKVGEGTTFKVFLPAIATPAQPVAASQAGGDVRGGTETILLVEDEHAVRMTTRRMLESRGYRIHEATCAREALELWHSHAGEIALLLTDIIMPHEMTGRELAARLWEQRPGLKVIFMSGYSAEVVGKDTDFIRRTKSEFLQKPCSSRALLEAVRRCLDEIESVAASDEADRVK